MSFFFSENVGIQFQLVGTFHVAEEADSLVSDKKIPRRLIVNINQAPGNPFLDLYQSFIGPIIIYGDETIARFLVEFRAWLDSRQPPAPPEGK